MRSKRREWLARIQDSTEYWRGLLSLEIVRDVARIMKADKISQAKLAAGLGSSQPYVSKILNGNTNFTLQTMIKIARALGAVLHVRITRHDEVVQVRQVNAVVAEMDGEATEVAALSPRAMTSMSAREAEWSTRDFPLPEVAVREAFTATGQPPHLGYSKEARA